MDDLNVSPTWGITAIYGNLIGEPMVSHWTGFPSPKQTWSMFSMAFGTGFHVSNIKKETITDQNKGEQTDMQNLLNLALLLILVHNRLPHRNMGNIDHEKLDWLCVKNVGILLFTQETDSSGCSSPKRHGISWVLTHFTTSPISSLLLDTIKSYDMS